MARLRTAAFVAAAAGLFGAALAAPAHAATGYDRCPSGSYCMFSELDGGGDIVVITSNVSDLRTLGIDKAGRSDWNRTTSTVWLYSDYNYSGCDAITSAGDKGNYFSSFQDFFSSVQIGGSGQAQSC